MIARGTLVSSPGGDTIQVQATAEYIMRSGVQVDVYCGQGVIDYSKYDILHFFNIIRPDDILPHILKSKLPFVVSTIFVDYSEYDKLKNGLQGLLFKFLDSDKIEYIKSLARFLKNGDRIKSFQYLKWGHRRSVQYIALRANLLLPNSKNEYLRFKDKYNLDVAHRVVVNAIDKNIFNIDVEKAEIFNDHVLCVGRIEGRKNQLNLIKALINTDLKLTIIGKPSPNHLDYYEECMNLVQNCTNIQIMEHVEHSKLVSIYKAARVHVLPSWFETTGLSSLEAGLMGCNIVVTKKGDTEEYFGDYAYYCEPGDLLSIRQAVLNAYESPVNEGLRAYILENFTWEKTAEQTFSAYEYVLGQNSV